MKAGVDADYLGTAFYIEAVTTCIRKLTASCREHCKHDQYCRSTYRLSPQGTMASPLPAKAQPLCMLPCHVQGRTKSILEATKMHDP